MTLILWSGEENEAHSPAKEAELRGESLQAGPTPPSTTWPPNCIPGLFCSLRTEDDSGPNPACKSILTNPQFVYFPKAYFVIGLSYVLVYMMIQRLFLMKF